MRSAMLPTARRSLVARKVNGILPTKSAALPWLPLQPILAKFDASVQGNLFELVGLRDGDRLIDGEGDVFARSGELACCRITSTLPQPNSWRGFSAHPPNKQNVDGFRGGVPVSCNFHVNVARRVHAHVTILCRRAVSSISLPDSCIHVYCCRARKKIGKARDQKNCVTPFSWS